VLVQPYMIIDTVTVWKHALENDFIKSKHVVLIESVCFHLVVETDTYRTCWYISTLGCQNTDYSLRILVTFLFLQANAVTVPRNKGNALSFVVGWSVRNWALQPPELTYRLCQMWEEGNMTKILFLTYIYQQKWVSWGGLQDTPVGTTKGIKTF
jgi:hypothetical protein